MSEAAIDLSRPSRVHIVGLGGAGMSAIAEVLLQSGHSVSGSDLASSAQLDRLADHGATTFVGHAKENLAEVDVVALSTAIPPSNPEVVEAGVRGIPILRRAELLTAITRAFRTISVAGTHGKTTTSAMLTAALLGAGLDPSFIVGGDLLDLDRGAGVGESDLLVVEADESDGTFLELHSSAAIITNIEPDHLEHYGGFDALVAAFRSFAIAASTPGRDGVLLCVDDDGADALATQLLAGPGEVGAGDRRRIWTYGSSEQAQIRIEGVETNATGISFSVRGLSQFGSSPDRVSLQLQHPGMHNARNATAALAMAAALGADATEAADALSAFGGVGRRFQDQGASGGVRIVEDYAHLPSELSAALEAARSQHPRSPDRGRIVAAFQPHRFSRTQQLWETFTDCFAEADVLLVADIYASGEAPRPGISADLISEQVASVGGHPAVRRTGSLIDTTNALVQELQHGDLCLLLGAGDINTIGSSLLEQLARRDESAGQGKS